MMSKYYLEHMQLIVEKGGMTQLIIETLPSLSDAQAVRVAAQELHKLHPNVVLIVSFTCKVFFNHTSPKLNQDHDLTFGTNSKSLVILSGKS